MFLLKPLKGSLACFCARMGQIDLIDAILKHQGSFHLQGLDMMARGHLIADVVTIIGTQDMYLGR